MADEVSLILWNQFNAGWIPSDDPINGRKNGLLQMDNLELDANGAIRIMKGIDTTYTLSGGATPLSAYITKIAVNILNVYISDALGNIVRNNVNIVTGVGATYAACFCAAYEFTLICFMDRRHKDKGDGTALVTLGLATNVAPTAVIGGNWKCETFEVGSTNAFRSVKGTWTAFAGDFFGLNCAVSGITASGISITAIVQSYLQMPGGGNPNIPYNWSILDTTGTGFIYPSPAPPFQGKATDSDYINLNIRLYTGLNYFYIVSLQLDFLLVAPDSVGTQVTDYFTAIWTNPNMGVVTNNEQTIPVQFLRSDFQRVGVNTNLNWSTVYGYRISVTESKISDTIGIFGDIIILGDSGLHFNGGDKGIGGTLEYAIQEVNNTGEFLGKSELSPASTVLVLPPTLNSYTNVTVPARIDPQSTELWLFRRGNNLAQWYRVGVIISSTSFTWQDGLSDQDALVLNITYNLNLKSIAASSISDPILDIIGPIEGRWFYFTLNFMYPSEQNDPDLVDVSLSVRTTASTNEVYMWARRVGEATVLVGTSRDVYVLKGTFATQPDNTIDIYYLPLSVGYPPITRDATYYNGNVYYLASDGWRSVNAGGTNPTLLGFNNDLLYRGETRYGYEAAKFLGWTVIERFPIAIGAGKLWFGVKTATGFRFEVYDTLRQYWSTFNYSATDGAVRCTVITPYPDGRMLMCFSNGKIRIWPNQFNKLIDGSNQTIKLLSPVLDNNSPRNRKDSLTLKTRIYTGNDPITLTITDQSGGTQVFTITSNVLTEKFIDLAGKIQKTYQIAITGTPHDFLLEEIEIAYQARPEPLTRLLLRNNNFGTSAKKRIRSRSFIIDTMGNNVLYTGSVDGVNIISPAINTSDKRTVDTYFITDVFGVDYGGLFVALSGEFEYYGEVASPLLVEVAPQTRKFDQIGPYELFRYGRLKEFRVRILSLDSSGDTSTLPYTVYFDDDTIITGSFEVRNGHDTTYNITMPKSVNGSILRIEFGPVDFEFCRYYLQAKLLETGKDTDNRWVIIGADKNG